MWGKFRLLGMNYETIRLNTLLKSNVTGRDLGGRCRGSQECGSRFVNFACKFHTGWHAVFGSSHNSEIYNIGARAQ